MQLKTGLQFTASCIECLVIILYNYIEKLRTVYLKLYKPKL